MNQLESRIFRWLETNQPATIQNLRDQFREWHNPKPAADLTMVPTEVEAAVAALVKSGRVRVTSGKFYRSDMPLKTQAPRAPRKRADPRQGKLWE